MDVNVSALELLTQRSRGERLIYCENHSKPRAYPLRSHTGELENGCSDGVSRCSPVKRVFDELPLLGRYHHPVTRDHAPSPAVPHCVNPDVKNELVHT